MRNIKNILVECPKCGKKFTVEEWDMGGSYTQTLYKMIATKTDYNNYHCPDYDCGWSGKLFYKKIIKDSYKYYHKEFK